MKAKLAPFMLAALLLPGVTFADPWKDESGHGRYWNGRPYWEGHSRYVAPPVYYRSGYYRPPVGPYWYGQPRPYYYDDDDWEDRHEAYEEWREEIWEREKEARKRWRDRWD